MPTDHANGTGPFTVVERVPTSGRCWLANPDWWDGRITISIGWSSRR